MTVLILGFGEAGGRVRNSPDPADAQGFAAIFESLAWAGVIRDRLKKDVKSIPPIINGLWFVRNLVLHQGADVVRVINTYGAGTFGSATFGGAPFGGGLTINSYVFPPRSQLPAGRSKVGGPDYDALVAGEPIGVVFARALAAL